MEKELFESLLTENYGALQRYVNFRVSDREKAADILQEVCLAAVIHYETLRKPESFRPWLYRIARNKLNDHWRTHDAEIHSDRLDAFPAVHHRHSADSLVRETLAGLREKDRDLLVMCYLDGIPQKEAAQRLGIPEGTLKSRLLAARNNFRKSYPADTLREKRFEFMLNFPEIMPEYTIRERKEAPFAVVFEELTNWFIIPRMGERVTWAHYDYPARQLTETVESEVTCRMKIHDIEGVEIRTVFHTPGSDAKADEDIYYGQLTDTHCRWLGESYIDRDGMKHLLTFLDGEDFMEEWGFGENNCGNETHLKPKGDITRIEDEITAKDKKYLLDIVGRYDIVMDGKVHDTVCLMMITTDGTATEQYLNRDGRTVLWRRFNRDDWAISRYGKPWTELCPENARITINGGTYVHWYDCICGYILN